MMYQPPPIDAITVRWLIETLPNGRGFNLHEITSHQVNHRVWGPIENEFIATLLRNERQRYWEKMIADANEKLKQNFEQNA